MNKSLKVKSRLHIYILYYDTIYIEGDCTCNPTQESNEMCKTNTAIIIIITIIINYYLSIMLLLLLSLIKYSWYIIIKRIILLWEQIL